MAARTVGLPQCPVRHPGHGRRCDYTEHPGLRVHVDLSSGWPQQWIVPDAQWRNVLAVPDDPQRDALAALRTTT